jgi:hypothetical protein
MADGFTPAMVWDNTLTPPNVRPMTSEELAAVQLTQAQTVALAAIDAKTQSLLAAGFSYTNSGGTGTFDVTPPSQTIWLGLMLSAAMQTYPLAIGTTANTLFNLLSAADVQAWYAAGVTRVQTIMSGGVSLKAQIQAATSVADVQAIQDNRT